MAICLEGFVKTVFHVGMKESAPEAVYPPAESYCRVSRTPMPGIFMTNPLLKFDPAIISTLVGKSRTMTRDVGSLVHVAALGDMR